MDTPDTAYLNSDFAQKNHPFADTLDIESHNIHWYDEKPPSRVPKFIRDSHVTSISAVTARPLSEKYLRDEITAEWIDVRYTFKYSLPPKPLKEHAPRPPSPTHDNTHIIP